MNSKKNKNKNKPKPHTPVQPQKVDIDDVVTETPTVATEESISVERVPEVTSDIITPVILEKALESDTPKKPKRNRGKKKKSESEDFDIEEDKSFKPEKTEVTDIKEDKKDNAQTERVLEEVNLVPNTRKKKNKNKKSQEQCLEEQTKAEQELGIVSVGGTLTEKEIADVKIVTCVPVATEGEHETKKKKNKKKKRSDSEKSDKEEIVDCTAAFHKILEPKEDTTTHKTVVKNIENNKSQGILQKETNFEIQKNAKAEKELEVEILSKSEGGKVEQKEDIEPPTLVTDKSKESCKEEGGKGRKKSKKDKKHPPSLEEETQKPLQIKEDIVLQFESPEVLLPESSLPKPTESESSKEEISKVEILKSPKSRAKIAKPVENKVKKTPDLECDQKTALSEREELLQDENIKPVEVDTQNICFIGSEKTEDMVVHGRETGKKEKQKSKRNKTTFEFKEKSIEKVESAVSFLPESITMNVTQSEQSPTPSSLEALTPQSTLQQSCKATDTKISEQTIDISDNLDKKRVPPKPEEPLSKETETLIPVDSPMPLKTDVSLGIMGLKKIIQETSDPKNVTTKCETISIPESASCKKRKKSPKPDLSGLSLESKNVILEVIKSEDIIIPTPPPMPATDLLEPVKTESVSPESKTKNTRHEEREKKGRKSPRPFSDHQNPSATKESFVKDCKQSDNDQNKPLAIDRMSMNPVEFLTPGFLTDLLREHEEETENSATINAPVTGMGKKRQKSPMLMKLDRKSEPIEELSKLSESTKKVEHSKDNITETNQDISLPISLSAILTTAGPAATESEIISGMKNEASLSSLKEIESIKIEQIHVPEGGVGKKRKKSPKPKKHDVTPETKEYVKDYETLTITPTDSEQKVKKDTSTKTNFKLLPTENIEITSIKADESDGSSCDIVPNIFYPRSSSLDNNNNLMIKEVTTETFQLNISDTPTCDTNAPKVQGSGETPTPDFVASSFSITEIGFKPIKTEEKTDIKSKMMEVNKDMEDLRLSIEKSLAELTDIEASEKSTEKQFEKAQLKLDQIKEIAVKQESSKERAPPELGDDKEIHLEKSLEHVKLNTIDTDTKVSVPEKICSDVPPTPPRKENKGKGKGKKKGKQEPEQCSNTTTTTENSAAASSKTDSKGTSESKKEEKTDSSENTQKKGKQQSMSADDKTNESQEMKPCHSSKDTLRADFEPIERFEDALTSSTEDVNITFEIIANETSSNIEKTQNNPEINVTAPIEDDEKEDKQAEAKVNPVSQPKNLLGHPDIPVRLNKTDYKKEKNKTPNARHANVKVKDSVPVEVTKESKEAQTENKRKFLKDTSMESISYMTNGNEEYIYKYSFRKVFLPSACHVCKKDLLQARVPCNYCNLVFYCSKKHKDEDYNQHQGLCFAVSTINHLKNQKHLYADAQNVTGQSYRLLRMHMIVSCEKVLKRRLVPWEQEVLLYPRICADASCREWRQGMLKDCEGCAQISYCINNLDHLPKTHQRWCKSYSLYQKLVSYQQTRGRLEPKYPTKVMTELRQIPESMNVVLASLYEEKIDMNDIQYAALTQIATAPLTGVYCLQLYANKLNSTYANGVHKKSTFTIHVVGAELQFEADALNKWELFFLHLRPDVTELRLVLIAPDLNPSNLPLDLLGKIKLCDKCRESRRRIVFDFQDKIDYHEYRSTDFIVPDLVCAFNPSIERSSVFNNKDTWPSTIKCISRLKAPFVITSYTMSELQKDIAKIKEFCNGDLSVVSEAKFNTFASVRPDRNFITDDEMPLLFKNYCFAVVCGGF